MQVVERAFASVRALALAAALGVVDADDESDERAERPGVEDEESLVGQPDPVRVLVGDDEGSSETQHRDADETPEPDPTSLGAGGATP